jgi:endonuclease/exonuclease/phosphatase (EEP) superfamily protein YafD
MTNVAGARRYWWIWIGAVPVAAWALLRLLGIDGGFPLATLMAFTPYAALVALFVAALALALENWAASAVAGAAFAILAALVLPRTIGDGTVEAAGHRTLTALAANVHHGGADPAALVELAARTHADVLSVEELTPRFARELSAAGIERRMPFHVLEMAKGASGAGLYSRFPLRQLPGPPRFDFRMPRARLRLPGGGALRLVAVHPFPPQPGDVGVWEEALRSLPSAGRAAPWVLLGDFNATLDQSQFRDLVGRGYADAGEVAGQGLEPTFPQEGHLIPPVTIDHVLADRRLGIVEYAVEPLLDSDHRAVAATLALP